LAVEAQRTWTKGKFGYAAELSPWDYQAYDDFDMVRSRARRASLTTGSLKHGSKARVLDMLGLERKGSFKTTCQLVSH
jgi:hypothetical protein